MSDFWKIVLTVVVVAIVFTLRFMYVEAKRRAILYRAWDREPLPPQIIPAKPEEEDDEDTQTWPIDAAGKK